VRGNRKYDGVCDRQCLPGIPRILFFFFCKVINHEEEEDDDDDDDDEVEVES